MKALEEVIVCIVVAGLMGIGFGLGMFYHKWDMGTYFWVLCLLVRQAHGMKKHAPISH